MTRLLARLLDLLLWLPVTVLTRWDDAQAAAVEDERRHALVDEAARYRVAADTLMDEALALLDQWEAGGRRG